MVKYLRISSYIRKPFLIYDFATASEFPYIANAIFFVVKGKKYCIHSSFFLILSRSSTMVLVLLCWLSNMYFRWLSAFSTAELKFPNLHCRYWVAATTVYFSSLVKAYSRAATSALNYSLNIIPNRS
jgi:hypothetical protein